MSNDAGSNDAADDRAAPRRVTAQAAGTAWSRWQMPVMADEQLAEAAPAAEPAAVADSADRFEQELATLREGARREGWEQGLGEGRQAARGELGLQAQRWRQLMAHLDQPLAAMDAQVEQELALLALALARQVIHAELRTTPELVLPVIRQALAELPSASRKVRLHLHPEDAHLIGEGLPELHEASWQVIEDDGISRGGCLLESGSASIDATLETRIAEVVARLGAAGFDAPAAEPQA